MLSPTAAFISLLTVGVAIYMYGTSYEGTPNLVSNLKGCIFSLFRDQPQEIRSTTAQLALEDGIKTYKDEFDGVSVLIHRPVSTADKRTLPPCIIYFHGGGWTSGSTVEYHNFTHHLSKSSEFVVISVEYRLSPKFTFPVPFEDCLRATYFVLRNQGVLEISGNQIILAGDEAGGNLALSVALNITIEHPELGANIQMASMFYSPLQAFDFNLPSYSKHSSTTGFPSKEDMVKRFSLYLFGEVNDTIVDILMNNFHISEEMKNSEFADLFDMELIPFSFREYKIPCANMDNVESKVSKRITDLALDLRVSPMLAHAEDLKRLPFTYFIAPGEDPLRDESFMLYGTLRELDINKNEHAFYRLEKHGFLKEFKTNPMAVKAIKEFVRHLQRTLFTPKDL